jgi:myo-inositol 2-dehydrogenase / D-chiro-inositol 1-dehydrogenase
MKNKDQSRRQFLSTMAIGAAGTIGATSFLASCASTDPFTQLKTDSNLSMMEQAPDGPVLKAGVIGCGGRGTGAAINFMDAGPNLEITALGDIFPDQLEKSRGNLKQARGIEVADENCYTGFDNYRKVIDSGVDLVIIATPPFFRPEHVKYAIDAGKHVFQEKPVAVDPYGARIMDETTQKAKANNLCMVSGTIRRYQKDYIETRRRVAAGEIGEVVGANIIRNGGALWWIERKPEWSDMEYMIRNWGNFSWLSGDHIVEMFIHELDVMSWHVGSHPDRAIGYGGRMRRISGDQFDQFSVVYEYGNGKKAHCATRQINGCDNGRKQIIMGTKGYADASGTLYNLNDEVIWEYPYPSESDEDQTWIVNSPLVQEHVELITAIRTGNYINDSDEQIKSTRIAIMGRMATYTGREVTWDEVLNSDLRLGPEKLAFGRVEGIPEEPPVVGNAPSPVERYG